MSRTLLPCLLAASLACLAGTAHAATAHNSQAGSSGPNTHVCGATPYFQSGGCLSSYFADEGRDLFDQPPAAYRPARRLTYPGGGFPDQGR